MHLDGYNILPMLTGETNESTRQEIYYLSDDGDLTVLRYDDWVIDRVYLLEPAQTYVGNFPATFKDYPPRQKAASFSLEKVMDQLAEPAGAR